MEKRRAKIQMVEEEEKGGDEGRRRETKRM